MQAVRRRSAERRSSMARATTIPPTHNAATACATAWRSRLRACMLRSSTLTMAAKTVSNARFAVAPVRVTSVGKEASQHLGIEVALALEVAIEAPAGQSGAFHDLVERDFFKAVAVKETACAGDDLFLHFCAVTDGIRHGSFLACPQYCPGTATVSNKICS